MKTILAIIGIAITCAVHGVQPMPNGARINWSGQTNDLSYHVWRLNPPGSLNTNWQYLGSTTNQTFLYTNSFPDGTMFGVTANVLYSNGQCCYASDIGVAGWPPDITTPAKTVRLTPVGGGITVATNRWVKLSSDFKTYDDWLRFRIVGTNVVVEHLTSPTKPYLFMAYPSSPLPPMPGGAP